MKKKCCKGCGPQPIDAFGVNRSTTDGLNRYCRACTNDRAAGARILYRERTLAKLRAAYAANPEKYRARRRQWRKRNPAAAKAIDRRQYIKTADKQRRRSRRRYRANRAQALAYSAAWRRANPDKRHEYSARRRARKRGAGTVERVDRRRVYDRDEGVCQLCHKPVRFSNMHMDHRVPLSRGGTHTYRNCQTAHAKCNLRKQSKEV